MKQQLLVKIGAFAIFISSTCGCAPSLIDISPNRDNGVLDGSLSTAGLVVNMAGDSKGLYAVGLNSGVWKTKFNENAKFEKWMQLPRSPRYAHCIAVDPNAPAHIVVGERNGDAIADNNCGLWESFDAGLTFTRKNRVLISQCRNNIVNAVIITNRSTILTSTPNGIGRKEKMETDFTFDPSLTQHSFTSIAKFDDWIVARTATDIFTSSTDGKTWEQHAIQLSYPGQNFIQPVLGGVYSVCILQTPQTGNVYIYVPVVRNPNGPCIAPDSGIDPCRPGVPPAVPPVCNYSSFVVFNKQTGQWSFQMIRERGLGIGLGGRAFMKSFLLDNVNLKNETGAKTNLIYCGSQNIFKATTINDDGTAVWENITNANVCGEPKPGGIHSDIWDFHLDPSGTQAWVSSDGGVYNFSMNATQTKLAVSNDDKYVNINDGLHTLHIHESFVAAGYPGNTIGLEHYGYGSQDNGGWATITVDGMTNWKNIAGGDVNIIKGDEGNTELILFGTNLRTARLATFENSPPSGAKTGPVTIIHRGGSFQFIQTLPSETPNPNPLLDAVVLTTLPLQFMQDNKLLNVPGDLGTGTGLVILRNTKFAANPDINISMGTGWNIELDDLPPGPQAFWTSGGHADPTYFLLCEQAGLTILYRRKKSEIAWTRLNLPAAVTIVPYITDAVQHGPVFVNPYNPNVVYVSCTDGIYHSYPGFKTLLFKKDDKLTELVAENGKYPLDRIFPGGNGSNVVRSNQSNLNSMYALSGLAFNRYNPAQVVAGSPFTGVFLKDGNKWKDLSKVLPKPFTPVSSVNINNQGIYVTTEGRGILKIVNY